MSFSLGLSAFVDVLPKTNKFGPELKRQLRGIDTTAAGRQAGQGFGQNFAKQGGGVISKGFSALRSSLGPLLVPLGIGGAVAAIGKIGMAYEDNLNIFQAVTKATGRQMDQVAAQARKLGADVTLPGVSAAGAAEAMTELAKAGLTVGQSMDAARGTLQLARAASISEAQAAEITGNAINAFGLKANQTTFVVDELAAAANSSSVEIGDVSDAFKMAAAVFSGFQGPAVGSKEAITELNTAIAILGNAGIKGSDAGTSLKQMMLQLTGPTAQAKDQMQLLAARAQGATISLDLQNKVMHGGKSARQEALATLVKTNPHMKQFGDVAFDAAGKMRPLPQIIDMVTKGTKGMTQEERSYAITQIFGADASRSVIALMKGGLPTYEAQRKAVLTVGAAAAVAAAKNKGLRGAIDNVKSQLENAAISIYMVVKGPLTAGLNGLANTLAPLAGQIGKFAGFVSRNIGTIRDWAIAIGLVTAALKLNSIMLAVQAAGGVVGWLKMLGPIAKATRLWAAAQALLNVALIANPIGIVIVALAALGAGLFLAYRHSETFRAFVGKLWASLQVAFGQIMVGVTNLKNTWNNVWAAMSNVITNLVRTWNNVYAALRNSWIALMNVLGNIRNTWNNVWAAMSTALRAVGTAVAWLGSVFAPVFKVIGAVVHAAWVIIQVAAAAIRYEFTLIGKIAASLYNTYIAPYFRLIGAVVRALWTATVVPVANGIKAAWTAMANSIRATTTTSMNLIRVAWTAMANLIRAVYQSVIAPMIRLFVGTATGAGNTLRGVFTNIRNFFSGMASGIRDVWNKVIWPVFSALITGVRDKVAGAFRTAVGAITAAWNKVKEAARVPVAFVVNHVINPFVNGINRAASFFGVKDRITPLPAMAAGGLIPGYAAGGRIAGAPSAVDNRLAPATIPGVGAVKLAGGEFVVNARDTAKALPILQWINDGMKRGGPREAARRIGRKPIDAMGDGSEGWAFAGGGIVGWVKNVWDAVTDPAALIRRPFEAALRGIPGGGGIKDFLVGAAKKALGWAIGWLTGGGGAGGNVGKVQAFIRAQAGKPYIWASAGPRGYDCSGIVSAAYNLMKGKSPYRHTFSTEGLPDGFFAPGVGGPLLAGWSHPGQAPASSSTGHMAGQIGNLPFESRGSRGVVVGAGARRIGAFANVGHARLARGGLVGGVPVFDSGGTLAPGFNTVYNSTGRPERVAPVKGDTYVFNFAHPVEGERAMRTLVVKAVKDAKRRNELS